MSFITNRFILYFQTIRNLKILQILNRLFRVYPKSFFLTKKKDYQPKIKIANINFREKEISIDFINNEAEFIGIKANFLKDFESQSLLWKYNFFYCDFLLDSKIPNKNKEKFINQYSKEFIGQSPAKDPYVISLRLVNIIKWLSIDQKNISEALFENLQEQYFLLRKKIEFHLNGNHLLANIKALIFFEVAFSKDLINSSLLHWLDLLSDQLDKQILADGGHFELSPMYHNIILEDLIDLFLISKNNSHLMNILMPYLKKMLRWSSIMKDTFGNIIYFHDSVTGVSLTFDQISNYLKQNQLNQFLDFQIQDEDGVIDLNDSGFLNLKRFGFNVFFDSSNLKAKYISGHYHSSLFSIQLEIDGIPFISNPGISTYAVSKRRLDERSNYSHSCFSINNENTSNIWHAFRMAKTHECHYQIFKDSYGQCSVKGYTNSYQNHQYSRYLELDKNNIKITDSVKQNSNTLKQHNYYIYWPLHYGIEIKSYTNNSVICFAKGLPNEYEVIFDCNVPYKLTIDKSYYCKSFGKLIDSNKLVIMVKSNKLANFTTQIRRIK